MELDLGDCIPRIQGQQGDSDPRRHGTYIEPEEAGFSSSVSQVHFICEREKVNSN